MSVIVRAIFSLCVIQLVSAQNSCTDYTVSVEQESFVRFGDVSFNCSYNSTTEVLIKWLTAVTLPAFSDLYTAYPTDPDASFPEAGYEKKVDGEFVSGESAHRLTVHNASEADNFDYIRCVVSTPDCTTGLDTTVETSYTDPAFDRVVLTVNGEETCGEVRFPDPVTVTCSAISDPVSTVSLNISGSTAQSCSRVEGDAPQPWNCSVSAPVTNDSPSVICTAVFTLTGETKTAPIASILIGPEPWTD